MLATTFWEKTLCRSFRQLVVSVVLVSWWLVNFVSVVVGVLVALWWCARSVLTVFGDVLGVLLMFWVFLWCHGSVPVVSWWY